MNPCPCGYLTDPEKPCQCNPSQVIAYRKKLSGPLLDRIDLHLEVPRLSYEKLTSSKKTKTSAEIRQNVEKARLIQQKRFAKTKIRMNSEITAKYIDQFCPLTDESKKVIGQAVDHLHLSGRAFHRVLKLARTIADLTESEPIKVEHISEALQYRPQEQNF
jgi:magnesium chelatase family protein